MKFVLAITGGGSLAIGDLLEQGGASAWFLEGVIPYSKESLDSFLGFEPHKYCSALTARQMAMRAFARSMELGAKLEEGVGVACTATLGKVADEREGREHKAHLAIQTKGYTSCKTFSFLEKRTREEEEIILALLIANEVCKLRNVEPTFSAVLSERELEAIVTTRVDDVLEFSSVLFGSQKRAYKLMSTHHILERSVPKNSVIFPGSFNPLHAGHIEAVKSAYSHTGKLVYLEISATNVDKAPIDYIDIYSRLEKITDTPDKAFQASLAGVIISNTPKFYDKMWVYPRSTYLIGTDTFNRLFDRKYGDVTKTIDLIKDTASHFIVVPRKGVTKNIPYDYNLSNWYIENRFVDLDIEPLAHSSTAIRNAESIAHV